MSLVVTKVEETIDTKVRIAVGGTVVGGKETGLKKWNHSEGN